MRKVAFLSKISKAKPHITLSKIMNAKIKCICEHCGQHIECDEGYGGMQIDCPKCKKAFIIPAAKQSHKDNASVKTKPFFVKLIEKVFTIIITFAVIAIFVCNFGRAIPPAIDFFSTIVRPKIHSLSANLVPATFKTVKINGTVYVKLLSGESVALSMVKVAAYNDEYISNKMATLNESIAKQKLKTPDINIQTLADQIRLRTLLALNNGLDLWGGAVATAVTDKDGKYSITLPHTGYYSFFAITGRESPAGNERFIFFRRGNVESAFNVYTVDLNNDCEEVSRYTEGWSDETKNSSDDQTIVQDVMGWIMTTQYGLQDVSK